MNLNLIYITVGSQEEARAIGRALVESRLAACVNLIDRMSSMYWWNGQVQEDQEVVLIAKTRESLVGALIEKVRALHSYECPCVVSLPILDGNPPYLAWLEHETRSDSSSD